MVYADYEYYKTKYLGTLPENCFDSLIIKASREIDKNVNTILTETKINNLQEEAREQLKYTACALVELLNKKQENENKRISSYSIDGVSKTFKTISKEEIKEEKREILLCLPSELTKYL